MAVTEQPTNSAFTGLPHELLDMILDHLRKTEKYHGRSCVPTLCNLRLTCRQFARWQWLLRNLFQRVRLIASPEHARHLQTMDMKLLAQSIQSVQVMPGPYDWFLDRETYEEAAIHESLVKLGMLDQVSEPNDSHSYETPDGIVEFNSCPPEAFGVQGPKGKEKWSSIVNYKLGGKAPVSDKQLDQGYQLYMAKAMATRDFVQNGDLRRAWTAVMGQFQPLKSFEVTSREFKACMNPHEYTVDVCDQDLVASGIGADEKPVLKAKGANQAAQQTIQELAFTVAMASIMDAGTTMDNLTVECEFGGDFEWIDNGELENLAFPGLRQLLFYPRLPEPDFGRFYNETDTAKATRAGLAAAFLLSKCAASVEQLNLAKCDLHCMFPGATPSDSHPFVPILPRLRTLTTGAQLNAPSFAQVIAKCCPNLESMELKGCPLLWRGRRALFRAIRRHPNRMQLDWSDIGIHSDIFGFTMIRFTMRYHTGEETEIQLNADDTDWEAYRPSLRRYMHGSGPWDDTLKSWFSKEPTEDSDEDL